MQQWEYMQVIQIEEGKKRVVRAVNNKALPRPWPDGPDYFNQLGREGWELVAVINIAIAVFKRPLVAED